MPIVTIRFSFKGGSTQDPDGKEGLSELMSGAVRRGRGRVSIPTRSRPSSTMPAPRCASARRATRSTARCACSPTSKDEAFDLLRLAVEQPRFDAAPIDRIRAQMVSGIVANAARSRDGGAGQMGGGALRRPSLCAARRRHGEIAGRDHGGRSARLPQGGLRARQSERGDSRRDRRGDGEAGTRQAVRRPAARNPACSRSAKVDLEARPGSAGRLRSAADVAATRLSRCSPRRARLLRRLS